MKVLIEKIHSLILDIIKKKNEFVKEKSKKFKSKNSLKGVSIGNIKKTKSNIGSIEDYNIHNNDLDNDKLNKTMSVKSNNLNNSNKDLKIKSKKSISKNVSKKELKDNVENDVENELLKNQDQILTGEEDNLN